MNIIHICTELSGYGSDSVCTNLDTDTFMGYLDIDLSEIFRIKLNINSFINLERNGTIPKLILESIVMPNILISTRKMFVNII